MTNVNHPTAPHGPAAENHTDAKTAKPYTSGPGLSVATRRGVERGADLVLFATKSIRRLPAAIRLYPSEVGRQAGALTRSATGVVLFVMFVLGFLLTLQMTVPFINAGISSYMGNAPALVSRGLYQIVFAWTLASKIGCGIVAELGAMRISDEIDAMEVMGIRSITYLVSTRIAASLIVLPFLWFTAVAVTYAGSYLAAVSVTQVVSQGGFLYILFLFQNMFDFVVWLIWAMVLSLVVIVVACYFGFTAEGGPVGVGRNTAWAMLINIVLISMIAVSLNQLFYGNNPNMPIGN